MAKSKRKTNAKGCMVVMYHYVHDRDQIALPQWSDAPRGVHGLTPKQFGAQLDDLCGSLRPLDWATFHAWLNGRAKLSDDSFLLTFDDGLADHAQVVLPMLEERGLRGVFFVPGAIVQSPRMLPAHAVHLLLERLGDDELAREVRRHLFEVGMQSAWYAAFDQTGDVFNHGGDPRYAYESASVARLKYLLTMVLPIDVRNETLDALLERHVGQSARWARNWYMGLDDLKRMQSLGHTIGAHGFSHEPYSRLSTDEQRRDVYRAAVTLNEHLGALPRPFCFPFGACDETAQQACRDAGFAHAFTTQERAVRRGDDPFALPRIDAIHVNAALDEKRSCPVA